MTFIAKCDGGPHLVWKEIPLIFNMQEPKYYDSPLASLQGTLDPAIYGVFHEQIAPRNRLDMMGRAYLE